MDYDWFYLDLQEVCPTPHGYSEAVRRQRAAELGSSLGLEQVNVGWSLREEAFGTRCTSLFGIHHAAMAHCLMQGGILDGVLIRCFCCNTVLAVVTKGMCVVAAPPSENEIQPQP